MDTTTPFIGVNTSSLFILVLSCSSSVVDTLSFDGRTGICKVSSLDTNSKEINFSFLGFWFRSKKVGILLGTLYLWTGALKRESDEIVVDDCD